LNVVGADACRDLKTANVFLDEEGNAVIGDLGVARLANEKVENSADISGTYRWMAPEVSDGFAFARVHNLIPTIYLI
jgi:serine/threonine protein kinase